MLSSVSSASSQLYCRECGAAHPAQATRCFACGIAFSTASVGTVTRPFIGLLTSGFLLRQRYQILEVLSQEPTKATYKAKDTRLSDRLVLIKEIDQQDDNAQDASTAPDAHRREALLLTGLVHPNLPRVYDFFLEGGRGYFVMDFLVGETLEEYLNKSTDGSLPADEVLAIGIQLSSVLDYLQMRQLPLGFKDLSLNNILRTPDGQLYVLDVDSSPTPSNTAITDLGTTLRQLLRGKPASRKLVRFAPSSLFRRPRPSRVEYLIGQMMSQDARKRPVSMRVVNQELQYIATQEVAGRPFRKRRISRRTLLRSLAGLSIGSGTGVLFGFIGSQSAGLQLAYGPNYPSGLGRTVYMYKAQLPDQPPWYNFAAWVLTVAWSPNGKYIAVGCGGSRAYIVDTTTRNTVLTYTGHRKSVEIVAWSPLGHAIASGSDDTTVRIWDPLSGKDSCVYRGHATPVIALAWSPDGKYIASGTWLPNNTSMGYALTEHRVHVWEARTGRQIALYAGHSDWVNAVTWSPNGEYVASASSDGTVQIWEAMTGRLVFTYRGHLGPVYTASWSSNGNSIASGGEDQTVQVWSVQQALRSGRIDETSSQSSLRPTVTYKGHSGPINNLAWSPDGRYIASASDDVTVQLWHSLTGDHIFTYKEHTQGGDGQSFHGVMSVSWSPNGKYIVSGAYDGTARIWNAR